MAQHNVIHGSRGVVKLAGSDLLNLTGWSLDVTATTAEATPMGDAANSDVFRWAQYTKGHTSWTASTEGYLIGSASDVGLVDAGAASDAVFNIGGSDIAAPYKPTLNLYLAEDSGLGYFTGSCLVVGFNAAASSTDHETYGISWEGTSKLTFEIP